MLVQITTSTFGLAGPKPIDFLKENDISFKLNPYGRKLTEGEAVEVIDGANAVIAGTEPLTEKVLRQLPDLKIISRCGTGMNSVDLETAKKLGIKVYNTPNVHINAVAELALTGALACLRNVVRNDQVVREGKWKKIMGLSLFDKKVGIIGFGKVGRKFCELLLPFTKSIFYYDPFASDEIPESIDAKLLSLEELAEISDVISLHVPYNEENRNLINADLLGLCKKNVTIINTARGGVINEDDLYDFLKDNPEAGAYLDVFEEEPYRGRLKELANVTLSPHVATTSKETRENMELEACKNLVKGLRYE